MPANEIILIEIREDGARVVKKSLDEVTAAGTKTEGMAKDLKTALGSLVSGRMIRDVGGLADNYANLLNRLRVVTTSQKELNTAMEGVAEMSRRTRSSLEANVDMYSRMAINTKDLGLEYKDVIKFADQVNKAVLLSGVTAREAQWGMVQFSQALASNALRGDELRAVLEQLPIVTDVIAKHFGVTRGELRQLGFQGRITAADILEAFENAGDELNEKFAKRLPTIDQAMTVLRGTFIKFIGTQDQMLQGTSDIARALLWVSDNMDTLGRAAEFAGIAMSIYFGTGLIIKLKAVTAALNSTIAAFVRLHPLLFAFGAASIAVATYSDKLKLAEEGTATLADLMVVFKNRVAETAGVIADTLGNAFNIDTSNVSSSLGKVLRLFATALDGLAGIFVGIRRMMEAQWNQVITLVERGMDGLGALFMTLRDVATSAFMGISLAATSSMRGVAEAAKGNFALAKQYAQQAALDIKNAFAVDFGDSMQKNLEKMAEVDTLDKWKSKGVMDGATWSDAFVQGVNESNMMVDGLNAMFDEAEELAQSRGGGEMQGPGLAVGMTPQELEIYKRLTGDVEKTQQAIQNLSNVAYKDLLLQIKLTRAEMDNGSISQGSYTTKMQELTTQVLTHTDSIKELNTLRKHGIITEEQYGLVLDEVTARQNENTEAMNTATITAAAYNRELLKLEKQALETSTTIRDGFKRGFMEVGLEMTNFAKVAEDVVTGAFGSMEDALVSFVTTGKVDFRSMVNSILGDLTRLITRMIAAKLFESLASSAGGPFGAIFGALAGGAGGAARASGGPVSASSGYTVGENGPEPFQPGQQGRIINDAAKLTDGEGGGAANVTVVVVQSNEEAYAAMESARGQRILVNTMSQNKEVVQQGG